MPCIYSGIFEGETHFKRRCSEQSEKGSFWQSNLLQMDILEMMLYQELTEGAQYRCLIFSEEKKLPESQEIGVLFIALLLAGWAKHSS